MEPPPGIEPGSPPYRGGASPTTHRGHGAAPGAVAVEMAGIEPAASAVPWLRSPPELHPLSNAPRSARGGTGGTRTRSLRLATPAPSPLGHDPSRTLPSRGARSTREESNFRFPRIRRASSPLDDEWVAPRTGIEPVSLRRQRSWYASFITRQRRAGGARPSAPPPTRWLEQGSNLHLPGFNRTRSPDALSSRRGDRSRRPAGRCGVEPQQPRLTAGALSLSYLPTHRAPGARARSAERAVG